MKILVNGVYATRKTTFGNWLQSTHGIKHIDLEAIGKEERDSLPSQISSRNDDLILTWGVPMEADAFQVVRAFANASAVPWWFDADLPLARIEYVRRSGERAARAHFDPHMARLAAAEEMLGEIYQDRRIRVLTEARFLDPAEIWQQIQRRS
jgi:hypothetical protein